MIKKTEIKPIVVLFAWVLAGSTILMLLINFQYLSDPLIVWRCFWMGLGAALLWVGNGWLSEALSAYVSWTERPLRRLLVSLLMTVLYTFLVWWLLAAGWSAWTEGFMFIKVIRHFTWLSFWPTLFITAFISIFLHGRAFLMEWRLAATEAEKLKKEQIASRYETLKNQVNPHFLFNSLNVLTTLVHKDADLAEQFVRQLSAVYRYVLDSRDREAVTLAEEVRQLEAYVFLMNIRFGESFVADIQVQSMGKSIAPLTLQMLVENAVKHNEVSKRAPLKVEIQEENGYVIVRNNLQPRSQHTESSGVGLENIRARYQFLSNQPVVVLALEDYFEVKIPLV